jgi:hypothetical protein
MKYDLQELRRSAVISTHGPGALIDFRAENGAVSGIAAGLEEWDRSFGPEGLRNKQTTREPRLQKKLGVQGFRTPPVLDEMESYRGKPDTRRLVAVRFPNWLQCPRCNLIKPSRHWASDLGKAASYCGACSGKTSGGQKVHVVPVRFVRACRNGHVDEFPWDLWVSHRKNCDHQQREETRHKGLRLVSERHGLAGLILSCPKCGARRSMDGIFSGEALEKTGPCRGRRPWLADGDESCDQIPKAVQRGGSNLYFPVTESALSIPPWSDRLQEVLGTHWASFEQLDDRSQLPLYVKFMFDGDLKPQFEELGMSIPDLARAIESRLESHDRVDTENLRLEEFQRLSSDFEPEHESLRDYQFEVRNEPVPPEIEPWISTLVRVVRLREVRAITGFTRIDPPSGPDSPEVAPLSKQPLNWLPAIEMKGEGIFIAFDEEQVSQWESQPGVVERVGVCEQARTRDWIERYGDKVRKPDALTARYVLCHTLAHVLMRQLTLECGYSSASLQERIYAGIGENRMAGVLIYTATTDSDGTLGGLARQGSHERFGPILRRAIEAVEWCSSDPLCITDMMGAVSGYSHSVCHSCCLAPETSCEAFNNFLDRAYLTGDGTTAGLGFFESLLRRI